MKRFDNTKSRYSHLFKYGTLLGRYTIKWFTFVMKRCFCPKYLLFKCIWWLIPFIQMHMVINISLDLLIGTWISTNKFIVNRNVWLFIDEKTHLLVVIYFWNWKIWTSHLTGTSQNEIFYIDSHSKFAIGIQYMM
jgi:hypothetical protein